MPRKALIPEAVFLLPLSGKSKLLYAVFLLHRSKADGNARPSRTTMSKMAGISKNCLSRHLKELARAKLIERRKIHPKSGAWIYHVTDPATIEAESHIWDSTRPTSGTRTIYMNQCNGRTVSGHGYRNHYSRFIPASEIPASDQHSDQDHNHTKSP